MPPVNRNEPKRAESSESTYTLMQFIREFPDNATCLEWLWRERFAADGHTAHCPKCEQARRFHRVKSRPSYSCDTCGHHLHPTAGTIFHKSSTSLHLWFYAMYLMTSTRCAVSAKHLERELGVTYKTAWRMANLIRNKLMVQDDEPLSGEVEMDETFMGGKPKAGQVKNRKEAREWAKRKTPVVAAVERGGRIKAMVAADSSSRTLGGIAGEFILPAATIFTDDWRAYKAVGAKFAEHYRINHSEKIYVRGNVHTNTIEGFFGNLKTGIAGNYHSVSKKWLQGYLNEYAWRYNHRKDPVPMFRTLVGLATADQPM